MIAKKIREYYLTKKTSHRRAVLERCGEKAFGDPQGLRYPIVDPWTCKTNCGLVQAAKLRASQFHDEKILKRIARAVTACQNK